MAQITIDYGALPSGGGGSEVVVGEGTFAATNTWSDKVQLDFKPVNIWLDGNNGNTGSLSSDCSIVMSYVDGEVHSTSRAGADQYIDTNRFKFQINDDNSFQVFQNCSGAMSGKKFRFIATS